jgi:phage terminase large subunit
LDLTIDLQPKQTQLYNLVEKSDCTNIGYGGSRGGGKSYGARSVVLLRRIEHPKTSALIFRRTYGELFANHIDRLFKEHPELRIYYNVGNKTLNLPNALGGGTIVFGHAENPGDIYSFQGQEFMDILVDEATTLTQSEIDFLRTCKRWKGVSDRSCKMILTCNPGGVGHTYIKRVMIDKQFQDNEIADSFAFIPAFGWDNIEWAREALKADGLKAKHYYSWSDQERFQYFITRTQYGRDLNALPETLRIQHLLGRWDYFEGQVFPELCEVHNLDKYMDTSDDKVLHEFVESMRKVSAHDHASTGITAHELVGINTDEDAFVFDEYYKADRLISEHSEQIRQLLSWYGKPEYTLIDPSTEAKTLQNVKDMFSVQDAYRREGLTMMAAHRASIGVGIDLIKEYLKVNPLHRNPFTQERGSPRLFISRRRCPNLWREMSELQVQNNDGKVEYIGADHACDCLRYILMSRPRAAIQKKMDIAKLPALDQVAHRSMDKFFSKFGQTKSDRWF